MTNKELVTQVCSILKEHLNVPGGEIDVKSLGNQIYVVVDGTEFVLVSQTTVPERRWAHKTELL